MCDFNIYTDEMIEIYTNKTENDRFLIGTVGLFLIENGQDIIKLSDLIMENLRKYDPYIDERWVLSTYKDRINNQEFFCLVRHEPL